MSKISRALIAAAIAGGTLGFGGAALAACDGAGVIIRIDGHPQEVVITRTEGGATFTVSRPRVLEVVCRGDIVHTIGVTSVTLAVDGKGNVKVDRSLDYVVPERSGAPSVAGNAYRSINDQVMPDMKRMPWNVRIKGVGDDFGFALPSLAAGGQKVHASARPLVVRLVGGTAPYAVTLKTAAGALVAQARSDSHEVLLTGVTVEAGDYQLEATDAAHRKLQARFTGVDESPPLETAFANLADAEIRIATSASALARGAPGVWSFEAEQLLQNAPASGLDRDRVFELIENYSED